MKREHKRLVTGILGWNMKRTQETGNWNTWMGYEKRTPETGNWNTWMEYEKRTLETGNWNT